MSPEQALAQRGVVDQRTDIYALGVTLYELLTLRLAFDGRDHQELLRQIALDEPVPPSRHNPAVRRDLETIVLKAMAKEPSNRYATAQELAADLRRFLDDQPILARRPGFWERARRSARRHRDLLRAAAVIGLLAMIVSTFAIWTEARKAEAANRNHHAYIVETFPLLDTLAMESMTQATKRFSAEKRERAISVYQQALNFYKQASELLPADAESRAIIARAYNRLGFVQMVLSGDTSESTSESPLRAQAEANYQRSLSLFERLHAENPTDRKICRYFADALGVQGWAWQLSKMDLPEKAKPLYGRAIELWRALVCSASSESGGGGGDTGVPHGAASELHDVIALERAVGALNAILENEGNHSEADALREQFDADVVFYATRFSSRVSGEARSYWIKQFIMQGHELLKQGREGRAEAALYFRLGTLFDPDNATMHNNLAWAMMSFPDPSPFPTATALASAWRSVQLKPKEWMHWNTLGVVAFRVGDWKAAADALRRSVKLNDGGGAIDLYFLAMTLWHEGKLTEARELFRQAADYLKRNPGDPEIALFDSEAKRLLNQPSAGPEPQAQKRSVKEKEGRVEAVRKRHELDQLPSASPLCSLASEVTAPLPNPEG